MVRKGAAHEVSARATSPGVGRFSRRSSFAAYFVRGSIHANRRGADGRRQTAVASEYRAASDIIADGVKARMTCWSW